MKGVTDYQRRSKRPQEPAYGIVRDTGAGNDDLAE
jgi:hypothetical protein